MDIITLTPCLRRSVFVASLLAWLGLLLACGTSGPATNPKPSKKTAEQAEKKAKRVAEQSTPKTEAAKTWSYEFVETKKDPKTNGRDTMDLYSYSGPLVLSDLKAFCKERKQQSSAKAFYYVVIFDDKANATFPTTPFTSDFGGPNDEGALKHIRAVYTFNRVNGFSELRYYDENAWESPGKYEKI
jgi:hypothetical protein